MKNYLIDAIETSSFSFHLMLNIWKRKIWILIETNTVNTQIRIANIVLQRDILHLSVHTEYTCLEFSRNKIFFYS